MLNAFSRTELLIGKAAIDKLKSSKIAIFGIGGVGSYAVEALVRSGVGKFVLVDDNCICLTNLNRQIHAARKTIGKPKVEAMKERILEINPDAEVTTILEFYLPETHPEMLTADLDYIIDAIDTITGKIGLIEAANRMGIPIISSMGTGNKLDPTRLEIADISKTSVCPLAKVMRKELRKRGINNVKVLFSKEEPLKPRENEGGSCSDGCICPPGTVRKCTSKHQIPGSMSFVPSVAGLIIAGEVIRDIIKGIK